MDFIRKALWRNQSSEEMTPANEFDQNSSIGDDRTPLLLAAENGEEEVVRQLLAESSVDPNAKDSKGRTPLLWAIQNRHEAVVKILLADSRVDPNSQDMEFRQTPLIRAVIKGSRAIVEQLLAKEGVDPNLGDWNGRTPLSWASGKGYVRLVELLIENKGVHPDLGDSSGRTPLLWAVNLPPIHEESLKPLELDQYFHHSAVVSLLLDTKRVNPNSRDHDGRTPLSWAAGQGYVTIVRLFLAKKGVDPDYKSNGGRTPLSWAAGNGNEEVIKLILGTASVNPDSRDKDGRTPLSWAAQKGSKEAIKLLLRTECVDPDSRDKDDRTPLSWAAQKGGRAAVKLLLSTDRVDPNFKDKDGGTPLSWADKKGQTLLSRVGMSWVGMSWVEMSWVEMENMAVKEMLLKAMGVDPKSKDNEGSSEDIQHRREQVRMDWTCSCGYHGYDSYIEEKPGALKVLAESLKSSHAITAASCFGQFAIPMPEHIISTTNTLLSSLEQQVWATTGSILPMRNPAVTYKPQSRESFIPNTVNTANDQAPQNDLAPLNPLDNSSSASTVRYAIKSNQKDYMLLCIKESQWKTTRVDVDVSAIRSDRELFDVMRLQYFSRRGRLRRWLSVRTLQSITFVKFDLRHGNEVDCFLCPQIPPENVHHYDFAPRLPEVLPPIGNNFLMHRFVHRCVGQSSTFCLNQIPKRKGKKPEYGVDPDNNTAWGLRFQERTDWSRVFFYGFLGSSTSFLFGVLWSVMHRNIQEAFSVAAYILAFEMFTLGTIQAALGEISSYEEKAEEPKRPTEI